MICRICGGRQVGNLADFKQYFYCPSCKTAWKKEFQAVGYQDSYYQGKSALVSRLFSPVERIFYFIRRMYAGMGLKKLWIDVGAGEGKFLNSVRAKSKIGVEASRAGRQMMKKLAIKTISEKEFLKKSNSGAEVISFWHVLEHIENPEDYLRVARANLQKNGKVLIGIPNIESFDYRVFKNYWFHLAPNHHFWHFSPTSIKRLLEKSRLKINYIDYFSVEHHLPGVLQSFINWTTKKDNLLHGLIKRGLNKKGIKPIDIFWIVFWLTLGLPFVLAFWFISSILKKPGTLVVVASPK